MGRIPRRRMGIKRRKEAVNITGRNSLARAGVYFYGVKVSGNSNLRALYFIRTPEEAERLKRFYPKLRRLSTRTGVTTYYDLIEKEAYLVRNNKVHDFTKPVVKVKVSAPHRAVVSRSGGVTLLGIKS